MISLDQPMVIEVSGPDAGKILHNLTTNQVQSLQLGQSIESFVTDVRGWVVAHGLIFLAQEERWLIVGQHPQPSTVSTHIDRYIIRENAKVVDLSSSSKIEVNLNPSLAEQPSTESTISVPFDSLQPSASLQLQLNQASNPELHDSVRQRWAFERIARFWPRMGEDIWEKCIPQELDRTEQAISFTKGCYLGQETIARLDARGQIQKKLCLLKLEQPVSKGESLFFNDVEVGHVTSSASCMEINLALAVVRRGYFSVDTRLTCRGFAAQVINAQSALSLFNDIDTNL